MPAPLPAAAWSLQVRTAAEDALYPCSDGELMAENMWQSRAMLTAAGDLGVALPEALVALDILVYPEQGNPRNRIAPDVLAAFGLGTHNRLSYLVWREGKPPDWVLEVASPSTVERGLDVKRRAYAAMGVPEYWQFDPQGLFPPGTPRLQGMALADGRYEPLAARLINGARTIRSRALGLDLRADGELIRFRNPVTGKDVRHHGEAEAAARRLSAERKRATADLDAEYAQIAELEAAIQRMQAGSSDDRA